MLQKRSFPQSFNRYAYVGNDPVNRTDPSGLEWDDDAFAELDAAFDNIPGGSRGSGGGGGYGSSYSITPVTLASSAAEAMYEQRLYNAWGGYGFVTNAQRDREIISGASWLRDPETGRMVYAGGETWYNGRAASQFGTPEWAYPSNPAGDLVREFNRYPVGETFTVLYGGSVAAGAGIGLAAAGGSTIAAATARGTYTTVSRWGSPGLKPGDFVMKGGDHLFNWFKSGKWQPGMGNQFAAPRSGQVFNVLRSSIRNIRPGDGHPVADSSLPARLIKNLLGQRIFDPKP